MRFFETTNKWMRFFETTNKWIFITGVIIIAALFVHFLGMTGGFTHGPFEVPNWYHTWPRFDEITHPLSSCAVTAILLNFNLPMSYRKKWIISLILGMVLGILWEIIELIVSTSLWWMVISPVDTLLDLHQDFYGSVLAIFGYTITMRGSSDHVRSDFLL